MKIIVTFLILAFNLVSVNATELRWMTDIVKARTKAKAENKKIFIDFTGSDWCPHCQALNRNVLTSSEFGAFAQTNFILVVVDFPEYKPETREWKAYTKALKEKFNVDGFPTVLVLDSDGKEILRKSGYGNQDAKSYVEMLKKKINVQ